MRVSDGSPNIILLHLSLSRIFSGSAKANRECRMRYLVWFELLILRPDALPVTNNTLLVPGPRRYSLRRSIVMPDRRANYIYIYIYTIYIYIASSSSSSRFNVCSHPACGSQTGHQKSSFSIYPYSEHLPLLSPTLSYPYLHTLAILFYFYPYMPC